MPRPSRYVRCLALTALAALAALWPAAAQENIRGDPEQTPRIWFTHQGKSDALMKGEGDPADAAAAADAFAKYFVYRMTWHSQLKHKDYLAHAQDFERRIRDQAMLPANVGKNLEYRKLLTKSLIACLRDVFSLPAKGNHVTLANTSMLLPWLGKMREEAAADFFIELMEGKGYHDVVRFWAARGLREFFPVRAPKETDRVVEDDNERKQLEARKVRDIRNATAALKFLDHKWDAGGDTKEEQEALHYLRREAIRTLAQVQLPAFEVTKDGTVVVPVAHGLARVLAGGKASLSPPPSLSEKLEAAIGICQLRPAPMAGEYQPEVGVRLVGNTLLDFITAYIEDQPSFDKGLPKDERKAGLLPWKLYAARFEQALADLEVNTEKHKVQENVRAIRNAAAPTLRSIKLHNPTELPALLRDVVGRIAVPSPALFRNIKGYDVALPAGGD